MGNRQYRGYYDLPIQNGVHIAEGCIYVPALPKSPRSEQNHKASKRIYWITKNKVVAWL